MESIIVRLERRLNDFKEMIGISLCNSAFPRCTSVSLEKTYTENHREDTENHRVNGDPNHYIYFSNLAIYFTKTL
jgi:hypothetical protein